VGLNRVANAASISANSISIAKTYPAVLRIECAAQREIKHLDGVLADMVFSEHLPRSGV
jgi:hypothetical protein